MQRTSLVRSLVFAFPIVPRNYTRYEAANNLDQALERPLISLSGPSAKSATPSRCQGLVGSVYSRSVAEATVYGYTNLLATPSPKASTSVLIPRA